MNFPQFRSKSREQRLIDLLLLAPCEQNIKEIDNILKESVNINYFHYSDDDYSDLNIFQIVCTKYVEDKIFKQKKTNCSKNVCNKNDKYDYERILKQMLTNNVAKNYENSFLCEEDIYYAASTKNPEILKSTFEYFKDNGLSYTQNQALVWFIEMEGFRLEYGNKENSDDEDEQANGAQIPKNEENKQDQDKAQEEENMFEKTLEIFTDYNFDLNMTNSAGKTAIYLAAYYKLQPAVTVLLKKKHLVDFDSFIDDDDNTARKLLVKNKCCTPEMISTDVKDLLDYRFNRIVENEKDNNNDGKLTRENTLILLKHFVDLGYYDEFEVILKNSDLCGIDQETFDTLLVKSCTKGYHKIVSDLLVYKSDIKNNNNYKIITMIWYIVKLENTVTKEDNSDFNKCFQVLLEQMCDPSKCDNFDINQLDKNKKSLIYYAMLYKHTKMCQELTKYGASLVTGDLNGLDVDALIQYFDSCVSEGIENGRKEKNSIPDNKTQKYYSINITSLLENKEINKNSPKKEKKNINKETETSEPNEVIINVNTNKIEKENKGRTNSCWSKKYLKNIESEMLFLEHIYQEPRFHELLSHPLIVIFLGLKWYKIRTYFYINLAFYLIFLLSLVLYILLRIDTLGDALSSSYFILLITCSVIVLWEILGMFVFRTKYFKHFENWIKLSIIAITITILVKTWGNIWSNEIDGRDKELYAFALVISITNVYFLTGNIPILSKNVMMTRRVLKRFFIFLTSYLILIFGFAASFYVLFHNKEVNAEEAAANCKANPDNCADFTYSNPAKALFKTLIMLTGEYDSSNINFSALPYASYPIFLMFIITISIGMLNLLTGLAIDDIQKVEKEAIKNKKLEMIEKIANIEKTFSILNVSIFSEKKIIHISIGKKTKKVYVYKGLSMSLSDDDLKALESIMYMRKKNEKEEKLKKEFCPTCGHKKL